MTYEAPSAAVAAIVSAASGYTAAAVAAGAKALAAPIRTGGDASAETLYPALYVQSPPEPIYLEVQGHSVTSKATIWAIVVDRDTDKTTLDARLLAHQQALGATFLRCSGPGWRGHVVTLGSVPSYLATPTQWVGVVGAEVEVTIAEKA